MKSSEAGRSAAPSRRRLWAWFSALLGGALVLALVLGGFYATQTWRSVDAITRTPDLLPTADPIDTARPEPTATAPGSLNYVLMGSDSRGGDRGRSDVLMLAHVTPERDRVYLISFTRDMWVDIPGRGFAKINAAYAYGGAPLAVRTVESLVGVRMDHAVVIDFTGFAGLTEALGGVTVDNAVASSSEGYSWPAGEITLSGDEALAYVRQRYELPEGDLDRAERQRTVVKAALTKLTSAGVLANPAKFTEMTGLLSQYVTVDEGLTTDELFSTASSMRITGSDDIRQLQAPISGFRRTSDGQAVNIVDEENLAQLAAAIREGTMDDYWAAHHS